MADALASIAMEKLTEVVGQQLSLFAGATHELEGISDTFQSIQVVLADAESRQVHEKSVQLWLSRLIHVAYDIEDLVEDLRVSRLGDEEGNEDDGNSRSKVRLCFPFGHDRSDYVVSHYRIARDVIEIRKRLDQIDDDKSVYNFISSSVGGDDRMLVMRERQRRLLIGELEIVGRHSDEEILVSRLVSGSCHEDDGGQVHVLAVVGIGGQGKTTLAQRIYHNGRVRDHFNKFLWVCVSDVFDVIRLTKEIIEQAKGTSTSLSKHDSLQDELLQELRGKRFFLVLDDVWNDDEDKWKLFRFPLKSGAQGSRILVTTRSQKVAYTMEARYIHELQGLSDDDSWELFRSIAFVGRNADDFSGFEIIREETANRFIRLLLWIKVIRSSAMHSRKRAVDYSEIESIGKKIVNTCKGVPFMIKAIGSYMNSKRTVEDWKNILDDEIWSLPQVTNEILPSLLLTYYHLPPHLKRCFVYCSMFPKDWVFEKDMLVRLWFVQGFIRSDGNRDVEDIGADYFDDSQHMFQEIKENCEGKIICKMHDLLHDLAKFIAMDEIYTFINRSEGGKSNKSPSSNVLHAFLSFTNNDDKLSNIPIAARRAKKLRTLWLHRIDRSDRVIVDILRQAKSLRALSLMGSKSRKKIVKLPDAIWKMRHLRYLDFSSSDVVELPESVSLLRNLHILDLTGCVKLKRLPKGMGGMVSLKYLEIERTDSLECLPEGLGRITSLRSLCKFIVGGEGGCQIDELQQLNSLQGSLRIHHLERVSSREEADKAELQKKPHLRRLVLSMSGSADADSEKMDGVIEGLRPHENLEELKLFWYTGSNLPKWLEEMPRLHKLELCGCPNLKGFLHHLTSASLRELIIRNCDRIEGISSSSSSVFLEKISVIDSSEFFSSGLPHLPNLKTFEICRFRNETLPDKGWEEWTSLQALEIWNCNELKSLPDGLMHLKSLQRLEVCSCKKLESLPNGVQHLSLLRRLSICGCPLLSERCKRVGGVDWPKISHIPNIEIDKQRIQ